MNKHHVSAEALARAHGHSMNNRHEVQQSLVCGCFHCKKTFHPSEVHEWTDGGDTALCPKCGIDSVIGDKGVTRAVDEDFLRQMRRQWFGAGNA